MIPRETLLDLVARETKVSLHLFGKLDPARADWRPAENMRTTLELLRYLTHTALSPLHHVLHDDWKDHARLFAEPAAKMTFGEFPERMHEQEKAYGKLLASVDDATLATRHMHLPWGAEHKLAECILYTSCRFFTAYRQQLFLYAKMAGAPELNTYNCWLGIDPPKKP